MELQSLAVMAENRNCPWFCTGRETEEDGFSFSLYFPTFYLERRQRAKPIKAAVDITQRAEIRTSCCF